MSLSSIRTLRVMRLARLVRIMRLTRVIHFVRALRQLILTIICTLRSLVWSLVLLFIIIYVFSIFFTEAVMYHRKECTLRQHAVDECAEEFLWLLISCFGSLLNTMYFLLLAIT